MLRWGLCAALLLSGCASLPPAGPLPTLMHHGPTVEVEDVDVLALSPDMQAFLDRYVLQYNDKDARLRLLITAITDSAMLGFHYRDDRTYTASEAFDTRSGNCIGFANLIVALGRRAGLEAGYQQVTLKPEWSSVDDTLLVARHVNVVLKGRNQVFVVDTSGLAIRPDDIRRYLSDARAKALYYNNLGAEAILRRDLYGAWAHLVKAVQTAPDMADPWINLGVVYGRNWQLEEAAQMYRRALDIDRGETAALSNLYEVYLAMEDEAAARELEPKVERYRQRNPYYLLQLGEEALEESRLDEAEDMLLRAVEQKGSEHLFHLALARTQFLKGESDAAQASLARARELAPEHLLVDLDRPLAELAEDF